jgi:hypothetical protein
MKKFLTMAAAIALFAAAHSTVWASGGTEDLIKMARSGVEEEVLLDYINASPDTFDLSAEDIITLRDLGVSSKVISEALRHGQRIDSATARETVREATSDTGTTSPAISTAAAVAPPVESPNISFFYESLYPYGNWIEVDGTWCWQPNATVISVDWAPYCNHGRWVYSDWGWCWVSDYSWGWAPFHYGRWFHHRKHGWCWVPDTEWGPAWVAWRRGDDYCGWAPLPPRTRYVNHEGFYFGASLAGVDFEFKLTLNDYHFVPTSHFCDPHPWVHMVPRARAEEVYKRTIFVRNGYGFEHDHLVNHGMPVEEVSRAVGRNIKEITIVHDQLKPGQPIHRGMVRENQLVIYRPAISPAAPENPGVIKTRLERMHQKEMPDKELIKREKDAVKRTVKEQRAEADNAKREKADFEKAAKNEADSKKRAELQGEADVRSMREQQAENHIAQIKKWSPPKRAPVALPQSVLVPRPSPEDRQHIQTQVKSQVQQEAREEQQRRQAAEEMVRTPRVQQPRQEQPRMETPRNEGNSGGQRGGHERPDNGGKKR